MRQAEPAVAPSRSSRGADAARSGDRHQPVSAGLNGDQRKLYRAALAERAERSKARRARR